MPCYELICSECSNTVWPVLPEEPVSYVCNLCRSYSPETKAAKAALRLRASQLGAQRVGNLKSGRAGS